MVYIHIDSGVGNDRTFQTVLVAAFSRAADPYYNNWTDLTFATGEKKKVAVKYEEFLKIILLAQERNAIPNLLADNLRNVYYALGSEDPVMEQRDIARDPALIFTHPKIHIY